MNIYIAPRTVQLKAGVIKTKRHLDYDMPYSRPKMTAARYLDSLRDYYANYKLDFTTVDDHVPMSAVRIDGQWIVSLPLKHPTNDRPAVSIKTLNALIYIMDVIMLTRSPFMDIKIEQIPDAPYGSAEFVLSIMGSDVTSLIKIPMSRSKISGNLHLLSLRLFHLSI